METPAKQEIDLKDPSTLYLELTKICEEKSNPHADGDCQLVCTTKFTIDSFHAWALFVHDEKKAYPILLSDDELRCLIEAAQECLGETANDCAKA